jgi:hypothetical protein
VFYKLLGFFVWKTVRYYVRNRVGVTPKVAAAGTVALLIAALVMAGSKRVSS